MARPIEPAGFCWAGFLCLIFGALKLTVEKQWTWWRVLLPVWAVLGHNLLYISVGFVWLFDDGVTEDEIVIRERDHTYGYQLAATAVLCDIRGQRAEADRGSRPDGGVLAKFGPLGVDLRVRDPQCGVAASVLVGSCPSSEAWAPQSLATSRNAFQPGRLHYLFDEFLARRRRL